MKIEEIIEGMTSKDVSRIRNSGAIIIRNSQNEFFIKKLIPYKRQIEKTTYGLELGGAFASNNRFYKFPIEIIGFHKGLNSFFGSGKKCTCQIYLSKTYECFNPEKEAENETIQLNHKIKGNWTHDIEIECLKCGNRFYVSERHYHYVWWKWTKITDEIQVNKSGNTGVDNELRFVLGSIRTIIKNEPKNKNELKFQKERLKNFRMKLAYNRGTEFLESKYGWKEEFDKLNNEIEIKTKA